MHGESQDQRILRHQYSATLALPDHASYNKKRMAGPGPRNDRCRQHQTKPSCQAATANWFTEISHRFDRRFGHRIRSDNNPSLDGFSNEAIRPSITKTSITPAGFRVYPISVPALTAGWQDPVPHGQLEESYSGSMGTPHCREIRTGIRESTIPVLSTSHQGIRKSGIPISRGGQCPCKEGSNNTKGRSQGRVLLNSVLSSKERGAVQASYRLASSEQVPSVPPFQDGRYSPASRPVTGRGLDVQDRPKGRILCRPNCFPSPEIPEVRLERSNLPVYLPPVWSLNSTTHLHKVVETSGRAPSQQRSEMHNLFGRYPHPSTKEGYAATSNSGHSRVAGVSRFSGELQEVTPSANPGNNFSWFHSGLNQETAQSPSSEDEADKGGGQQASEAGGSVRMSIGMFHRETNSCNIGHLSSTFELQTSAAAETRCPQESRIRWYNAHISEGSGGSRMVGQQPNWLEWQRPQQATTPDGSGDGCLQLRLGGILSRGIHWGLLGASGESTPYQRTGVVGSLFWSQSVRQTQKRDKHSTVVRQSDSSVSYEQNGRHQVTHSSGPYKNSVAMVPQAQNFVGSTTHSRKGQFQSRLLVTTSQRQDRLDPESGALQCHQPAMGTSRGRPVCQQVFCTTSTFLQLVPRPRGRSNRRLCSGLKCKERVCTSPLVFDNSGALQGASSASLPGADGTSLANTSLVPCSSVNAGGHSYPTPNEAGHCDSIPQLRLSSPGHSTQAGRLESLRQRFR